MAASYRRSLARERTLREASSAFASAGSIEEVAAVVKEEAAADLRPSRPAEQAAILGVRDGDFLRRVGPPGSGEAHYPLEPLSVWMQLSAGPTPRFAPVAEIRAARYGAVPDSPAPDAPRRNGVEGGLLCPLTLKDRPVGDPLIGLLGIFGDQKTLRDLAGTLEILAGQAALAVERIGLTQEVVRQRGEVIAEGIESETECELLAGMGCQFGQGFCCRCRSSRPPPRPCSGSAPARAASPARPGARPLTAGTFPTSPARIGNLCLSLYPFTTNWMDTTRFATAPLAVYGVNLLASGVAYWILQSVIIRSQGPGSILKRAVGRDFKGRGSMAGYVLGCVAAIAGGDSPGRIGVWIAVAIFVAAAGLWVIPDRRIEAIVTAAPGQTPDPERQRGDSLS